MRTPPLGPRWSFRYWRYGWTIWSIVTAAEAFLTTSTKHGGALFRTAWWSLPETTPSGGRGGVPSVVIGARPPGRTEDNRKNRRRNDIPGQEFFDLARNQGGSYVPSGLTAQEYADLKKKEAEVWSKLDLGAFGPRFQKTARPTDDVFLLPAQLWTLGRPDDGASKTSLSPSRSGPGLGVRGGAGRLGRVLQAHAAPYILAWLVLDMLGAAWYLLQGSQKLQQSPPLSLLWAIQQWVLAALAQRNPAGALAALSPFLALNGVLAALLTRPTAWYLQEMSRRRLWTQRRLWWVTVGSGATLLLGWSVLLMLLARAQARKMMIPV